MDETQLAERILANEKHLTAGEAIRHERMTMETMTRNIGGIEYSAEEARQIMHDILTDEPVNARPDDPVDKMMREEKGRVLAEFASASDEDALDMLEGYLSTNYGHLAEVAESPFLKKLQEQINHELDRHAPSGLTALAGPRPGRRGAIISRYI